MSIAQRIAALLAAGFLLSVFSGCSKPPAGVSQDAGSDPFASPQPLLPLDSDDYLIAVVETDILADFDHERLVAVKKKSVPNSPIVVSIEGYDAHRRKSMRLWESATGATGFRGFTVSLMDLVGDHSMEIVCRGVNGAGRRTFDVFRKSYAPKSKGPAYTAVCEVVAEDIRIEKVERPEGYQTGQKNGPSFPVVAYAADGESRNPMDLVRTAFLWKYAEARYVAGPQEKLPAEKVDQRQLEELFSPGTSADGFELFLEGTWKKPVERTIGRSDAAADPAILFQPHDRKIAFYSVDTVEIYEWLESRRALYNGLLVIAENRSNAAASIRKIMSIFVRTPSSIEINIQGGDQYDTSDGTYARTAALAASGTAALAASGTAALAASGTAALAASGTAALAASGTAALAASGTASGTAGSGAADSKQASGIEKDGFTGTFLGEKGLRVVFSGDRAVLTDGKKTQSAVCIIFRLAEKRILSLRILTEIGLSKDQKDYVIEERDRGGTGRSARSLVLVPVTLTTRGYEETAGEILSEDPAAAAGSR